MTIKIFRPTKDGTHTFSRNRSIDPFNTSKYKEITPIGEEQLRNFSNNIYNFVTEEDKTRIFFLAEYIKRQFYLDCNVEKMKMVSIVKYRKERVKNIKYVNLKM